MLRKILFFSLLFSVLTSQAQNVADISILQNHIRTLASDSLRGRKSGSPDEKKAAIYIRDYFRTIGLELLADEGIQSFEYSGTGGSRKSQNVVALIPGSDPLLRNQSIVIGAHYDHVGYARFPYSRRILGGGIHPGADDNASGTALMMEMARIFKTMENPPKRNIILVAFGAEEQGLHGSRFFARNIPEKAGEITCVINFDMVGRLGTEGKLFISGTGTAQELEGIFESLPIPAELKLEFFKTGKGSTDSQSFYDAGFPVVSLITGLHKDYHTPGDVEAKINYEGLRLISSYMMPVITTIANQEQKLSFTKSDEKYPMDAIKMTPGWQFKGHLSGLYVGGAALAGENLVFNLPAGYEFLKTDFIKSGQFGINFWSTGLKITKNLGITSAIGIETNSYYLKGNYPLAAGNRRVVADSSYQLAGYSLKKNTLNDFRAVVPMALELKFPAKGRHLYIMAGASGSARIASHALIQYKVGNYRHKNIIRGSFNTLPFAWSAFAKAGYGRLGIYAKYQMSPFFDKDAGAALYPFSAGITFNFQK